MPAQPAAIEDHVQRCWSNGTGIGETIVQVRHNTGFTLGFEQVRRQFVRLADQHA